MLNDLSVSEAQQVAERLVRYLIDDADSLDPAMVGDVLQTALQVDEVQDLVAALLGISTDELPDWVEEALTEPEEDPEY